MMGPDIEIDLKGCEPEWWVKIVEFLNQNWALPVSTDEGVMLLFLADTSGMNGGVFDRISFPDIEQARRALKRNGFDCYSTSPSLQKFVFPPEFPLREGRHRNGPIYSSGRYWRSE